MYLVTDMSVEEIAGKVRAIFLPHLLPAGGPPRAAPQHPARHPGELRDPVLHRAPRTTASSRPASSTRCRSRRGKSIVSSPAGSRTWAQFYGHEHLPRRDLRDLRRARFAAATARPLKKAQELAARAFGARRTFFVTNGTSTTNKIVVQALVSPATSCSSTATATSPTTMGSCSSGAHVGLPRRLPAPRVLDVRRGAAAGDQAEASQPAAAPASSTGCKMLLLTNCTFDGIVYNVERVMDRVPRDQARHRVPLGRGLVRLRALQPDLPAAHRDGTPRPGCCERYRTAEYRAEYERARPARLRRARTMTRLARERPMPDPTRSGSASMPPSRRTRRSPRCARAP